MHLSKTKISGFKSFVDTTTIDLPGNLVAVVGPNGCGKSNIIDAITWVMGESSPKYLRGESLTDVIFKGSSSRKPVGQASVELVFDNADGTIGGEYGKFAEISVKRTLTRDSDSTYYLNGVRCRKRDVVDLFLGTGLGPRSYSIIGQNMITRMIEAKPDELRTYLEEAAGISKYKERRHETELRMNHTRDNLARVNDLRAELEKQLTHLKHQANVAEKYKTLKQQERVLRGELGAIQWRVLDGKMVGHTLQVQHDETALEARQSELTTADREIEQTRHEQRVALDAFQEVQRRYYAVGNEITRMEQEIVHHQEREQQWRGDLEKTESALESVKAQMRDAEERLQQLQREVENYEPRLASANKDAEEMQEYVADAEESMQTWQTQWDEFNTKSANVTQTAQVEKTRIHHLEERITSFNKRLTQIKEEQDRIDFAELNAEIDTYAKQSYEMADQLTVSQKQLSMVKEEIREVITAQEVASKQLDSVRSDLQRLTGKQSSLEALQQTALGKRNDVVEPWLIENKLNHKPRLGQQISVEKGWEQAVEKVLGLSLQAICVDKLEDIAKQANHLLSGNIAVINTSDQPEVTNSHKGIPLLSKVESPLPLASLLFGIYAVDTIDDAMVLSTSLNAHESVITRDGVWLSRYWLKVLRNEDPAAGVLQREDELKVLLTQIASLEQTQQTLERSLEEKRETLNRLEVKRDELQATLNEQQARSAQVNTQQKMKQERLDELKTQSIRFASELEECASQLRESQGDLERAKRNHAAAMASLEQHANEREGLLKERDKRREELHQKRTLCNQKTEHAHDLELQLQTLRSEAGALQQTMTRMHAEHAGISERKLSLQGELSAMAPIDTLKKSLQRALDKHVSVEVELNTAKVAVESMEEEQRHLEEKRHTIDRDINKVRSHLESLRIELQGWKVKADALLEQVAETGFTLENILKDLAPDVSEVEWHDKLEKTVHRINRLGPINLVAIDEYATCLERKEYLDKQVEDLQAGLGTLEDAIAKIDKETKSKFKDTFDLVNNQFQELFPTIFGGGKAYLELNSDNLLEAGITMMACPPGKRNSSIYLLSGGEKSLTAIALIFSIFHLNPAPFCLLDEVDAALDDANVLRFTRLVKKMADKTQFIFVSHNKITIEMAEHLIGVTMNEPGVSRLVSVDIEKAISMAEA